MIGPWQYDWAVEFLAKIVKTQRITRLSQMIEMRLLGLP